MAGTTAYWLISGRYTFVGSATGSITGSNPVGAVGFVGMMIGVAALVACGVGVGVAPSVPVALGVLVLVEIDVLVLVGTGVLVLVGTGVLVGVGTRVLVLVGTAVLVGVDTTTVQLARIVFVSRVTAPFCAKARPAMRALLFKVMLVKASYRQRK